MIKVGFHYISKKRWDVLNHERNDSKIIKPTTMLIHAKSMINPYIPELPDWAHDGYIFAFPDQEAPKPWKTYKHYNEEWKTLTGDIADINSNIVCLRFDILPSDNAYVVDRAHYADFQWGYDQSRQDAIRRYALSRVPANEYDGSFRMPELIIANPIELERLVLHNAFKVEYTIKNKQMTYEYTPIPI